MSEYIEIETEISEEDPTHIWFYTNLPLTAVAQSEQYHSYDELAEGSPLAQALVLVPGIEMLRLEGADLLLVRDLEVPEHALIADVSAVLKDFFL
jgi:hypothetical protein